MIDMRNSIIILAKGIKMDKGYKNVLRYSVDDMLELLRSESHLISSSNNYSFIRKTGTINTDFTYQQCLQANYIAFQNPDYSDMWFFAWIDNVIYRSDRCTELRYTVDVFSTWWDYWTKATCFVEREHPVNDSFGDNNLPEPISVDDYIVQESNNLSVTPNKIAFLFTEARKSDSTVENPHYESPYEAYAGGTPFIGNLPMTLWRVRADLSESGVNELMSYFSNYVNEGKAGDLVGIFTYNDNTGISDGINKTHLTDIGGYTPKYSKTLQYPFTKITLSNQQGSSVELRAEDFGGNVQFKIASTNNYKGQSICYPVQYKGIERNTDFGLLIDNYPTIPMTVDSFATYLAQNSTNIALSAVSGAVGTVTSVATGNPLAGLAGIGSMINTFGNIATARTKPDSMSGMASGNLINMLLENFYFLIEFNTCKRDIAEMADSFFNMYGYTTNRVKTPNLASGTHNYVKISSDSNIGYGSVPGEYMDVINNAFRNGVTLWGSHDGLGNY